MNIKLLTIITFLSLVLGLIFLFDNNYLNDSLLRGHLQEKSLIKGQLLSQYGIGIKTQLSITIDNQKEIVQSDDKGMFQINVKEKKELIDSNLEISINELIPGFLYSNPIMKQTIKIEKQIQLPIIIIEESGFGAIKIIGQISEKINNIHMFIELENNKIKYQSHAITNSYGQFSFIFYGITKLPILAQLSIEDNLQIYEPITQQKLNLDGLSTIIDVKTIQLQQSKNCRIQGCKTCNQNNQKCQECQFGYQLTENNICKFGTFKGSGKAQIQIQNFGKLVKIVGTLVNNKLEAIKNQLICISKLENDNVCISTGGTKHTGEFEVDVESLKEGQLKLWFKVNQYKQEILIDGQEQVMNIGIITIY